MELLVGTTNPGKRREIENYLAGLNVHILSPAECAAGIEIVEDGKTYEENALKKARALAKLSRKLVLADDSGLEVEALAGAPGVHSARYAGEPPSDERNNEKLLKALAGVPRERRQARFVCVLALCAPPPHEREWLIRGECAGMIEFAPRGRQGFGYDPLFYYPPLGKTFAELELSTKSQVSHRGQALRKLRALLLEVFKRELNC
ncbi:MAG TPA: XTP/dITP diphosphatase [Candidatus Acidoferrales bacterium]|nr:XTP/dITP diphosphatase [Candidatus Acidoferrales bacterium]